MPAVTVYEPGILERTIVFLTNSVGKVVILASVLIIVRLLAISGYDTQTALALAAGSDLFALTFSLFISAFSTVIGLAVSAFLLVSSQRLAHHAPVPVALTACASGGVLLMLLTTPVSLLLWLPLALGIAACATSLLRRFCPSVTTRTLSAVVTGVAIVGVCSLLGQSLLFNTDPFGHPHVLRVKTRLSDTTIGTGYIIGYPLNGNGDRVAVLEYSPRQVVLLSEKDIEMDEICTLPSATVGRQPTAAARLVTTWNTRRNVYEPRAETTSCFAWP